MATPEPGQIFDIQKPDRRLPDPTSRPIIGQSAPQSDPMMVEPVSDQPPVSDDSQDEPTNAEAVADAQEPTSDYPGDLGEPQSEPAAEPPEQEDAKEVDVESDEDGVEYMNSGASEPDDKDHVDLDVMDGAKTDGSTEPNTAGLAPIFGEEEKRPEASGSELQPIQVTSPPTQTGEQSLADPDQSGLSPNSVTSHPEGEVSTSALPQASDPAVLHPEYNPNPDIPKQKKPLISKKLLYIILIILIPVVAAIVAILAVGKNF